jgi:glycosyltransferase involved in cell wall biosynthesis
MALEHCVIISDLSQHRDGPTAIAIAAARALSDRKTKVSYICGDDGNNAKLRDLVVDLIPVSGSQIDPSRPLRSAGSGFFNKAAYQIVKKYVAEIDSPRTIYHVHSWSKILSPAIFSSLKNVGNRTILTAHDYFLSCPNGGYFNFSTHTCCDLKPLSGACIRTNCDRRSYLHKAWRVARSFELHRALKGFNHFPNVLAVHEDMVPRLERGGIPSERIKVLPNPVMPWSRERIMARRNRNFLFVGRLDHDKGVDLLAEAANRAGATVMYVGDGPLRHQLSARYPQFEFLGWRSKSELANIAKSARVTVVPTASRETFSLVSFESIMSGVPVLISEFANTHKYIVASGCGQTIRPYQTEEFAGQLSALLASDDVVERLSQRAWELKDTIALSPQQWSCKLFDIYDELAGGGS